jgi:radical SAM protein with 4Fe4S-binding SPASM domain
MRYYLSEHAALKFLENPCVYDIRNDELYELDEAAFDFLIKCAGSRGSDEAEGDPAFLDYCITEGLLQTRLVNKKRPMMIQSPVPSLRYLELQITDKCNLKCRHCYVGQSRNIEMPLDQLRSVLQEFQAMQGLRLLITGGEPLLHSSFADFNSMLPDYAFRKILLTNGLMLDKAVIRSLNADEIQFSVDGMEHGHDAIRGEGTFRKVVDRMEVALAEGVAVSASTMVHSENLSEFEEMKELFLRMGIKDWSVDIPCEEGNLRANGALMISPDEGGEYLDYGFGGSLHESAEGYGCGLHLAAVLAGGEICKCAFYREMPTGHIKDGLAAAWAKIEPIRLAELDCIKTDCEFLEKCRGGCRYRAGVIASKTDKVTAKTDLYATGCDFYKCAYYGIINKYRA